MKQLITFQPIINPTAGTLDFSTIPNFDINKLYAVVDITQNQPLYVPGAPGLGYTSLVGSVMTLQWNISTYSSGDLLNVYYDAPEEQNTNAILTQMAETLALIYREMAVQTHVLAEGLNINNGDVDDMRNADLEQ